MDAVIAIITAPFPLFLFGIIIGGLLWVAYAERNHQS